MGEPKSAQANTFIKYLNEKVKSNQSELTFYENKQ